MKTNKFLIVLLSTALSMFAGNAFALNGACVNCHTMHNSEAGVAVDSTGANGALLSRGTCVGCHTNGGVTGAPLVDASTMATAGSGGSFDFVTTDTNDNLGHNVAGFNAAENATTGLAVVPGYSNTTSDGRNADAATWDPRSTQVTCAGVNGCHGTTDTDEFAAVSGAHHGNAGNDGSTVVGGSDPSVTVGGSFRFLTNIQGIEMAAFDPPTDAVHNTYHGAVGDTDKTTISALCARCHGNFHARAEIGGSSNPWLRHPTDIDMTTYAASSEYAAYSFVIEAPAGDDVTTGGVEEIVTCLSCHYAHGSDQEDLLRFEYNTTMVAGGTGLGGCMNCHTTK